MYSFFTRKCYCTNFNCLYVFLSQKGQNRMFLLKEMAVFGTFFAKVRYLPYNAKKCAKNGHFFKQKRSVFNLIFKNLIFLQEWCVLRGYAYEDHSKLQLFLYPQCSFYHLYLNLYSDTKSYTTPLY